jgi:hypothetical protein
MTIRHGMTVLDETEITDFLVFIGARIVSADWFHTMNENGKIVSEYWVVIFRDGHYQDIHFYQTN